MLKKKVARLNFYSKFATILTFGTHPGRETFERPNVMYFQKNGLLF